MAPYDVIGNIAIVKFDHDTPKTAQKKFAKEFMSKHKSVTTVLAKTKKFSGRLRSQTTEYVAGDNTKEALCKENGCVFRFNVDTCYFSPRLSAERKEIALKTKKGENVLVMCGGVAPFAIVMAKLSKAKRIVSVELGRDCTKYAKQNSKRNKVDDRVAPIGGNVRLIVPILDEKFDRIVMARPQLPDPFLDVALPAIKKGGTIHYYGFCHETELADMKNMIKAEAKAAKKTIRILKVKKAGNIAVGRYRYRIDIKVN